MFVVIEKFEEIKSKFTIAQIQQSVVTLIIASIILWSCITIFRPVSSMQLKNIHALVQQQRYSESHRIAQELMTREKISVGQYLKLMHVYQYEDRRATQLVPLRTEQD